MWRFLFSYYSFCQEIKFMRRFVYNNTLKPSERRMSAFIPPTGGAFNGKWRRAVVLVRVKVLQMYSSGYLL